jgi:serine/threonine protein kinase
MEYWRGARRTVTTTLGLQSEANDMTLVIGAVLLGKYRIDDQLGEGGFGHVYRATDLRLGRPVAVKALKPEVSENTDALQRFLQEARAAANLNHPNIVTIHDLETGTGNFIVMEYMGGGSMHQVLSRLSHQRFTALDATSVAAAVCDGLAAAHAVGIVHRDIKPSNILFTADGRPKLADFGIAHVPEGISSGPGLTQTGTQVGTVFYMSPEQARGDRVDSRSDLYALGAVLYESVVGQRYLPFEANNTFRNLYLITNQLPISPRGVDPSVPKRLEEVIQRALAKDPSKRYQSADAMLAALVEVLPKGTSRAGFRLGASTRAGVSAGAPMSPLPQPPISPRVAAELAPLETVEKRDVAPPIVLPGIPGKPEARPGVEFLSPLAPAPGAAVKAASSRTTRLVLLAGGVVVLALAAGAAVLNGGLLSASPPPLTPTVTRGSTATPTPSLALPTPTLSAMSTPVVSLTNPGPTATAISTSTAVGTATPQAPTSTPLVWTATPTPMPTQTPRPPTPTSGPSPVQAPSGTSLAPPGLLAPASASAASGRVVFSWAWSGAALTQNQGFEVRLWKDGQPDHYGAASPVRTSSTEIDLRGAYAVQIGGEGRYSWTVAVVQLEPYQRIGAEATPRPLQVSVDGGSPGGPPPAPTVAPP